MPTKSLGCWAVPRTPASPTMPIAKLGIRVSIICAAISREDKQLYIPSSETSQADTETGTQLDEAGIEGHLLLEVIRNEHGDDQTVDTDDTSHDNGDNVWYGRSVPIT